jgi:hypothetical protein
MGLADTCRREIELEKKLEIQNKIILEQIRCGAVKGADRSKYVRAPKTI